MKRVFETAECEKVSISIFLAKRYEKSTSIKRKVVLWNWE